MTLPTDGFVIWGSRIVPARYRQMRMQYRREERRGAGVALVWRAVPYNAVVSAIFATEAEARAGLAASRRKAAVR